MTVRLGDVVELNPRGGMPELRDDSSVGFVPMSAVCENLKEITAAECRTYGEVRKGYTPMRNGDIIIAKITPCFENGKLALVSLEHLFAFGSTEFHVLRPTGTVEPRLLYHLLSSERIQVEGRNQMKGAAGQKRVPSEFFRAFEFRVPRSLAAQRRIAAILDKADAIRRKLQQSLRLSDDFLCSVFLDMFGNPVLASKVKTVVKVADAGDVQLGRQRAPKYQSGKHTRPYVRVANVFENRIDVTDLLSMDFDTNDFRKYKLEAGDILLNEGQSTELVGRPAMWRNEVADCCFQNTLVRFKAKNGICDPYYALFVFLHYLWFGRFASLSSKTSSVAHLGAARFAEMPFPLPDIRSQQTFAKIAKKIHQSQTQLRNQMSDARDLFASLQQRAFRGEL